MCWQCEVARPRDRHAPRERQWINDEHASRFFGRAVQDGLSKFTLTGTGKFGEGILVGQVFNRPGSDFRSFGSGQVGYRPHVGASLFDQSFGD